MKEPFVTVIMAVRNEGKFIGESLEAVLSQDYPADKMEIIIADGMSEDHTKDVIKSKSGKFPVKTIDNPGRIIPLGLNAAIEAARGEVIVRIDGHTLVEKDYVRRCVEVLQATNAENVGGAWRASGNDYWSSIIAEVFQSPFVFGNAKSRDVNYEGPADTVYLGCWRKETLEKIGGFDPEAVRNEDTELNKRIRYHEGIVWQSPAIKSRYLVLSSPGKYFKQWAVNGYWVVRTLRKHPSKISLRHWIFGGGLLSALLFLIFGGPLVAVFFVYLLGVSLAALILSLSKSLRNFPAYLAIIILTHAGYAAGFICGFLDFILLRGNYFSSKFSGQVVR